MFDYEIALSNINDSLNLNIDMNSAERFNDRRYITAINLVQRCDNELAIIAGNVDAVLNDDKIRQQAMSLLTEYFRYGHAGAFEQFKKDYASDLSAFHYNCLVWHRENVTVIS